MKLKVSHYVKDKKYKKYKKCPECKELGMFYVGNEKSCAFCGYIISANKNYRLMKRKDLKWRRECLINRLNDHINPNYDLKNNVELNAMNDELKRRYKNIKWIIPTIIIPIIISIISTIISNIFIK